MACVTRCITTSFLRLLDTYVEDEDACSHQVVLLFLYLCSTYLPPKKASADSVEGAEQVDRREGNAD